MKSIKEILMERETSKSKILQLESIREDIQKILRSPIRAKLKITKADTEKLRTYMENMDVTRMRSLREFLTVVPAISEQRVNVKFDSHDNFGAADINKEHPNINILTKKYVSASDELDIEINVK